MLYWLRRKVYRQLARPRAERLIGLWIVLDVATIIVVQLFKR